MPWKVPAQVRASVITLALWPRTCPAIRSTRRRHFGCGPAGEGQQENAAWIGAVDDEMGDTMRERVGLARSGPGDDQQRRSRVEPPAVDAVLDRLSLLGIELLEIGGVRKHGRIIPFGSTIDPDSCFVRNGPAYRHNTRSRQYVRILFYLFAARVRRVRRLLWSTGFTMTTDKAKAIETAVSQIERAFGKGAIMRLGGDQVIEVETISTGSLGLDIALGVGGLPAWPDHRGLWAGSVRQDDARAPDRSPRLRRRAASAALSMPSTRWTLSMPASWASIWTIFSSPSRTMASRRSRSPIRSSARAPSTSWSSTPWQR